MYLIVFFFFFQAEDGIRDVAVTGVQTCALPIYAPAVEWPNPSDRVTRSGNRAACTTLPGPAEACPPSRSRRGSVAVPTSPLVVERSAGFETRAVVTSPSVATRECGLLVARSSIPSLPSAGSYTA